MNLMGRSLILHTSINLNDLLTFYPQYSTIFYVIKQQDK